MKHRGVLAMEEAELEAQEAAAAAEPIVDAEVAADEHVAEGTAAETEAVAEVEAAQAEVVETDAALDQAGETAEVIEEVRDNVAEAAETEGGMSEPEARAIEVAVEHMLVHLGASKEKAKTFPAMEGFKNKATRLEATRVALEGLGEKIKALWQAIINNVQKVWDMVVAFVKALLNGTKFVEARANIIKKMASRKKDAKAGSVKVGKWGSKIVVGGKIPNAAELVKGVQALSKHPAINFEYGAAATEANAAISAMLDQVGKAGGDDKAAELFMKFQATIMAKKASPKLPLGDAEYVFDAKQGEDGVVTSVDCSIKAADVKLPESVEGMSPADAIKVADAVIANLGKFGAYEKQSGDIGVAMKNMMSKMKAVASRGKEGDSDAEIRKIAKAVMVTKTSLGKASTILRGYDLQACKAALDYAGASVSAAGKEAKKEAKEPAKAAA